MFLEAIEMTPRRRRPVRRRRASSRTTSRSTSSPRRWRSRSAAASASAIPEWRYLLDGDGGDENLKDYPIEENPELTIRSVLDNLLLYQEGWGVGTLKHSLTYQGGLSRGRGAHARRRCGGTASTVSRPSPGRAVIAVAEAIPFAEP